MKVKNLKIEDVCDFVGGSQPPKAEFVNTPRDGYVRLIQTRDYKTDTFPTYIPENSTKKFCDAKDIMIGRYGPPIFQICRGLTGAYNVALLKAKPKKTIDREYLYYFLKQDTVFQYVEKLSARTGGQTGVDLVSLNKYPIRLPEDIKDQKKLAAVLSALDAKIDCNNRINAELEAIAKTLYDYWFVQFNFPDANGKPYKSSGGKMVYNPTLKREIPLGWKNGILGDLILLEYGKGLKADIRTGNGYPVVGSNGVVGYHSEYLVEGPGIVVGRKGTVGAITYIHDHFFPIDTTYYVKPVVEIELRYLKFLMSSVGLEKMNSDSAVPGLNRDAALRTSFAIPPVVVIQKFESKVAAVFSKLHIVQKENQHLTQLRDWLLPMLMNGQVTVE